MPESARWTDLLPWKDVICGQCSCLCLLRARPTAKIKNLFSKYYTTEELKDDPYITLHLNHIISTYALTGLGTTLKSDLNSILDGARYMIVIDNINRKVIIHSTNKIINEIILKNNYSKGLVSKVNLNLTRI